MAKRTAVNATDNATDIAADTDNAANYIDDSAVENEADRLGGEMADKLADKMDGKTTSRISGKGKTKPLERTLWESADKLRKNMDAAEYKHIALGLIFLKYISDAFDNLYKELQTRSGSSKGADPEDIDEYKAKSIFFVPPKARWPYLKRYASTPRIGKIIDDAMHSIEQLNPTLQGVLPDKYNTPHLDPNRIGQLINLLSSIPTSHPDTLNNDLLGRVYEYFLGEFAAAEGKKGGQFYTPGSIVQLLVEMLEPYKGRVFDPCCGSGGMFVQSEKFVMIHQGRLDDISVYGQESNATTYRLCRMNLAIRGIDASNIKWNNEGSFLKDEHPYLEADYILANPPFNDSDWSGSVLGSDSRWQYGAPPAGNANFAWVQHIISHLSPTGTAGIVLSNGSLSSMTSNEGTIRKNLVEAGMVDCIVALPDRLFYNTAIPACLWFVTRNKQTCRIPTEPTAGRKNAILFIDARGMGTMKNRKNRILTDKDIQAIAGIYSRWRTQNDSFKNTKGLCKAASLDEVRDKDYVLIPAGFVGTKEEYVEDQNWYDQQMKQLTSQFTILMKRGDEVDREIIEQLSRIGFRP